MIKIIEKELLDDEFIIKPLAKNISLNETIYFSKNDVYYFGNYKKDAIIRIKNKLIKNKKRIIKAIEKNVRFIVSGNSYEIFNNSFKHNGLNLFTSYNPYNFKKKIKGIKIKEKYKNNKIKKVSNIKNVIPSENFLYKNLLCIKDNNILKENFL